VKQLHAQHANGEFQRPIQITRTDRWQIDAGERDSNLNLPVNLIHKEEQRWWSSYAAEEEGIDSNSPAIYANPES
jgi:hypothetical protein